MQSRDGLRQLAQHSTRTPLTALLLIGVVAAVLAAAAPGAWSLRFAPPAPLSARPGSLRVAADQRLREKTISFLGRDFAVPYAWPVIDLAKRPTTCVRFDMHAVYLGHPGADEKCPARGVGRHTGALLIEPHPAQARAGTAVPLVLDHPIASEIDVAAPGFTITASYDGGDRAAVVGAITDSGLPQPADAPDAPDPQHDSAPVDVARGTSQVSGLGFDTCTAPSDDQMQAWSASPFDTVGIYIGGSERACAQTNLSAGWISAHAASGWHFMPLYAGWQAAWDSLTATAPAVLGKQSADDAVRQAAVLGIGAGALLYYDMESYTTSAQSAAAIAFESAWTSELHVLGYRSAVYSSASTGIADLVAHRGQMVGPDVVDIAHWNGVADSDPGDTPPDAWQNARAHQYTGGTDVTYGGVQMNIDKDYLSIALPQPPNPVSPSVSPSASASPAASATASASAPNSAHPTTSPGHSATAGPSPVPTPSKASRPSRRPSRSPRPTAPLPPGRTRLPSAPSAPVTPVKS